MYIGQISMGTYAEWMFTDDGRITLQEVQYVPGLIKIINEIIDNSIDEAIKTNFKFSDKISITIEKNRVIVQDNGRGIPVEKNEDGHYYGELCWLHARSGSNFDDDNNQAQLGTNGVGSFATAVFSSKFIGETDDGVLSYKIVSINGAESFKETIGDTKRRGTKVTFEPDLGCFGISDIDEVHVSLIKTRLQNLSLTYPDIEFKFNGKKVSFKSKKEFLKLFSDSYEMIETDDYFFAVFPNAEDDFKQFSYMNGLRLPSGGTHIDIISYNITSRLRDALVKKYKTIKPGDIKNKLLIVMVGKNFKKLKFDSQTKEKITNSTSDTNAYLGVIDWDGFCKKILKNKNIIEPITEVYRIKEELKRRAEMKALDGKGKEKIKSEKYTKAVGENDMLVICEGQSAKNGLMPSLGRNGIAYYELKGKPLNSIVAPQSKFTANEELSMLYKIIKSEGFKRFLLSADADLDGSAIMGLLMAFIYKYVPDALEDNKCFILRTPIASQMKNKKPVKWVYSYGEIDSLGDKDIKFYKGYGSWKPEDLKHVISIDGLDRMLERVEYEKERDEATLLNWYKSENSDYRKEMIKCNEFDLIKI
jgi:DNA topoisomerase-2